WALTKQKKARARISEYRRTTVALELIGDPRRSEAGARKTQYDQGPTWWVCWTGRDKGGLRLVEYEQKLCQLYSQIYFVAQFYFGGGKTLDDARAAWPPFDKILVGAYRAGGLVLILAASDD